ncbi:UNVERIFIED_CONTAM: hypothetical protein FKN15_066508 [Acipenser sinensis]
MTKPPAHRSHWEERSESERGENTAYRALSNEAALDYEQVKQAILRRLNITPETHCRQFQQYQRPEGVRPRIVAQQLWDHMTKWLRPAERGAEAVAQSVAIDQFLAVVGADTQAWVARHSPETMEKAVELAEAYEDSLLRASPGSSTGTPSKPRMTTPAPTQKAGISRAAAASPSIPLSASPPTWRRRLAPSWAKATSSSPPGGRVCGIGQAHAEGGGCSV